MDERCFILFSYLCGRIREVRLRLSIKQVSCTRFALTLPSKWVLNVQIMAIYEEKFNTKRLKLRKKCNFCKKSDSHWTFLLNISYICTVTGICGRHIEEAFSAVPSAESGQFAVCWDRQETLLPRWIIYSVYILSRVWAVFYIHIQAVQSQAESIVLIGSHFFVCLI